MKQLRDWRQKKKKKSPFRLSICKFFFQFSQNLNFNISLSAVKSMSHILSTDLYVLGCRIEVYVNVSV